MSKKVLVFFLVFVMVFSVALVGCGETDVETEGPDANGDEGSGQTGNSGQKDPDADKYGGTVRRIIWSASAGLLNPHLSQDTYDTYVHDLIYESMVITNPNMEYEGSMAERWEVSEDAMSVTFYLREGLKWHDGEPVTAEDVRFTFEFIAHPDYTGVRFSDIDKIVGAQEFKDGEADTISGIEVIDNKTIKITTKEVYAPFLSSIAGKQIIPEHIWSKVDIAKAEEATEVLRSAIGSGPFKMKHFEPDQYAELVGFEDYWQGRPYLDSFIIQVGNQDTASAQMVSGEIDFMDIADLNNYTINFLEEGGAIVQQFTSNGYQHLAMNNRLEIFSDKRVRHAFAYAINRQALVDGLMDGYGSVCNVPLPPGHWAYPSESEVNQYKYSSQKAIELLEEAGWEYKDDTMYRDGKPVELTLLYPTGNTVRMDSASLIQENFKDIGIKVELLVMDFPTLRARAINEQDFEMLLLGWGLSTDPDGIGIWHSNVSGPKQWNFAGYINDRNDELLEQGVKYLTNEDRKPIYKEWAQLINEELPIIFLYSMNRAFALNPKLKGTEIWSFGEYYNVHKWYFEK